MQGEFQNKIKCKCCGQKSVVPMNVLSVNDDEINENHQEVFYSCLICKDNWVADKQQLSNDPDDSSILISFTHNINLMPQLERVASVPSEILVDSIQDDDWEYYIGDHLVDKSDWFRVLSERREEMFSAAVN